jgi:uncharacterized protein YdiU (UPF0061 family)
VANWNLYRLASALAALDIEPDALKAELQHFGPAFMQAYQQRLTHKLGWLQWQPGDETLVDDWWHMLHTQRADFTLSFRTLAQAGHDDEPFLALFGDREAASAWLARYTQRLAVDAGRPGAERIAQMNAVNPIYVLRNHLAEIAIQAAQQDDAGEIETLLELLRDPFTARAGYESYAAAAPQWAQTLEVSCSS